MADRTKKPGKLARPPGGNLPAHGPVVAGFGAKWCAPWMVLTRTLPDLDTSDVAFIAVDVDQYPGIADTYSIVSVPTFVLIIDGREQRRITGATSTSDVAALMASAAET